MFMWWVQNSHLTWYHYFVLLSFCVLFYNCPYGQALFPSQGVCLQRSLCSLCHGTSCELPSCNIYEKWDDGSMADRWEGESSHGKKKAVIYLISYGIFGCWRRICWHSYCPSFFAWYQTRHLSWLWFPPMLWSAWLGVPASYCISYHQLHSNHGRLWKLESYLARH